MWILVPVANEVLCNLQHPAQNNRMQYRNSIIKETIAILFVFPGSMQKILLAKNARSWTPTDTQTHHNQRVRRSKERAGVARRVPNMPREENIQKESLHLRTARSSWSRPLYQKRCILRWELCPTVNAFQHN